MEAPPRRPRKRILRQIFLSLDLEHIAQLDAIADEDCTSRSTAARKLIVRELRRRERESTS